MTEKRTTYGAPLIEALCELSQETDRALVIAALVCATCNGSHVIADEGPGKGPFRKKACPACSVPHAVRTVEGGNSEAPELAGVTFDRPSVPMLIFCPTCLCQHIDRGEWQTKPHRTHLCEKCGGTFRPALIATVGVAVLPQNDEE